MIILCSYPIPLCRTTEEDMDGQALIDAFEMCPGPDCLKDVIPKYGIRIKTYKALQQHLILDKKVRITY